MKSKKRAIQIGALIAAITLSSSLKSLYTAYSSDLENINISETSAEYTPVNLALNFTNVFMTSENVRDYARQTAQAELLDKIAKSPDKDLIPEVYTTEGLDSYLESIANYKKSPKEEAFEKSLNKVLKYSKYKDLDSTLVDYYLLKASAWQESRFDSTVVSKAKAISYMQVQEGTHLTFRPQDKTLKSRFNTLNNIEAGIDYYLFLIDYVKKNHPRADTLSGEEILDYSIVAYNSGHGAYSYMNTPHGRKAKPEHKKWKIEFMPKESRDHLEYVRTKMNELKITDKTADYAKQYIARRDQIISSFRPL